MIPLGVLAARRPAAGSLTATFLGYAIATNQANSYTFTSQPLGTASATRTIGLGIVTWGHSAVTATIGGVGTTAAVAVSGRSGGAVDCLSAIHYANITTGTTATVTLSLTQSTGTRRAGIVLWHIDGIVAVRDSASGVAHPTVNLNADASPGDVILSVARSNSFGDNVHTWTGLTDRAVGGIDANIFAAADHAATTAETPRTLGVTASNTLSQSAALAVLTAA